MHAEKAKDQAERENKPSCTRKLAEQRGWVWALAAAPARSPLLRNWNNNLCNSFTHLMRLWLSVLGRAGAGTAGRGKVKGKENGGGRGGGMGGVGD